MTRLVRAAGGVVFRKTPKGKLRILVAHRPRYDDWTLPKGKADGKEGPEETAIREVLEETGCHCRIVASLGATRYRVSGGVKEVTWFAMRPLPRSRPFKKNSEVDAIEWLSRARAMERLSYQEDRELIAGTDLKSLSQTGTLYLLRHATAGERAKWQGHDENRSLTKKGWRQSEAIAASLAEAGIERILSSPYERCVQTVKPLAKMIGAPIETTPLLAEEPDLDATYALVDGVVGANAVICSHGDVIPALINRMMWAGLSLESRFYCSKGSIWVVDVENGKFTTGHYRPPPEV
ncbi:MAG TPA: NUDIX hydrolase [Acidimicrobiia bacterium]|nr:NUDIX hydrolase [Acidimicrobiia bacterium]